MLVRTYEVKKKGNGNNNNDSNNSNNIIYEKNAAHSE